MPRLKKNEVEFEDDAKDAFDIVAEGLHANCGITGCRPKFHYDDARVIIVKLRSAGLLKEGN